MPRRPATKIIRLILGDQLNAAHGWFKKKDPHCLYLMMETMEELTYTVHHIQKIAAFFAAMRRFAGALEKAGHRVRYLRLDDPRNRQGMAENILKLMKEEGAGRFEYQEPDEYRLDEILKGLRAKLPEVAMVGSEHFLCERDELARVFPNPGKVLMETFYRRQRKRHSILMEGEKPARGQWNYDNLNRNKYTGTDPVSPPKLFKNDVSKIVDLIRARGVGTIGEIGRRLIWPIDRRQSRALLRDFIENHLPRFGTYQDSMNEEHWSLFHSRLSFSMNVKMLSPLEVIRAATEAHENEPEKYDIAQVEGFVRQILGWREYMRLIYWHHMPGYAKLNYFEHRRDLPSFYWTGETKMNCMRHSIKQSLEHAYAHHIQRLMITGNFALLNQTRPDAVDDWYLGIYIDAIQWVEITNTRGMSQFGDGGIVGTKPYIGSANYINKMSDYCKGCFYSPKIRVGEKACPFNSLYWNFLHAHRDKLENNHRLRQSYAGMKRLSDLDELLKQARAYLDDVENL